MKILPELYVKAGVSAPGKGKFMASAVTTVTNARAVLGGKIRSCNLRLSDGKIQGILPPGDAYGRVIDAHGALTVPGFLDACTRGALGISFNAAGAKDVRALRDFYASHGVTAFLPAITADSEEAMLRAAGAIAAAKSQLGCSQIAGIHLEGPFLSPQWRGDLPQEALRQPSYPIYRRLQDASGGLVTRVTLSPELPSAPELTGRLASEGVRVTLGYSGASYEEVMECVRAGALGVSCLFRAMPPLSREEPGILGAALEQDLFCELLCDPGFLPPALTRLVLRAKGPFRTVAVTGSEAPAGLAEGLYRLRERPVALRDGALRSLGGGSWAGSVLTADRLLKRLMEITGLPVEQCLPLLTEAPARMLGLGHRKGSLEVGKDADLVFLDKEYRVRATISQGAVIYDASVI